MRLRKTIKQFSNAIIISVLLGGLLLPLGMSQKAKASLNQGLKHSKNSLRIKFTDGTSVDSAQVSSILSAYGSDKASKLFNKKDNSSNQNALETNLKNYYTIHFKQDVDMDKLVSELKNVPGVETAYPVAKPAPSPSTPDYSSLQNYLTAAPTGINSNYAKSFPGGDGSNAKIVDIEYSWNTNHEDLSKAKTALVPHGTPIDPFYDNSHGTAVLGEMIADSNGLGVTGAANGASLNLVNAYSNEYGYDLVGALSTAASLTNPGDVIMLEQQTWGPTPETYDFVPVEWVPEVYDAIKALTSNGRIVVEPAGNGKQNLNNTTYYGSSFPMGKPDSGAIIVGAGLNCASDGTLVRSRASFSTYGSRVNLQGPGNCVYSTGYGDLFSTGVNDRYTQSFSGTSSATPVVASAAAALSSAYEQLNGVAPSPIQLRTILMQNGTPQKTSGAAGNIGPLPDLSKALAKIDITAPSVPTNVSATPTIVNNKKVLQVSWTPSNDNVKVYSYRIYRNNKLIATIVGSNQSTYNNTSVSTGHTYTYQVSAVDASGNVSALSAPFTIRL